MDTDLKARKQVTLEQLKGLLDYLNENQDLAKGLTRGRRGKLHSVKLWNVCAKKLNAIGDGAVKDGKGWSKSPSDISELWRWSKTSEQRLYCQGDKVHVPIFVTTSTAPIYLMATVLGYIVVHVCAVRHVYDDAKYWCDWKYRVRRRALELKAARDSNKPPPDGVTSLSQMEDTILEIIGESVVSGVVIKSDPLAEGFSDEEESYMADYSEEAPVTYDVAAKPRRGKKRRQSSLIISDADDEIGTSSSQERKRKLAAKAEKDSDADDSATELIRLEREKLEYTKQFLETTREISSHMGKLVGVMTRIKDILTNHRGQ